MLDSRDFTRYSIASNPGIWTYLVVSVHQYSKAGVGVVVLMIVKEERERLPDGTWYAEVVRVGSGHVTGATGSASAPGRLLAVFTGRD